MARVTSRSEDSTPCHLTVGLFRTCTMRLLPAEIRSLRAGWAAHGIGPETAAPPRMKSLRFPTTATFLLLAVAACHSETPTAGIDESDSVEAAYEVPRLVCSTGASADVTQPDGTLVSVELKRDTLGTWLEVGGWELVAGMDEPLLGNRALPVAKIQKNGRSVGTHDGTTLTIEDTATGGLRGTFVQGARRAELDCRPVILYCATREGDPAPNPMKRLVLAPRTEVANFHEKVLGIWAPELELVVSPKGMPDLHGEMTLGLDPDPQGELSAARAHVTDEKVGTIDMHWDEGARKRLATFAPSTAFLAKYELEGTGVIECDITAPASAAHPIEPVTP